MSGGHTPKSWSVQDPLGDGEGDALWIVAEGATPQVYDWRCIAIVTSDDANDMDHSASYPVGIEERNANACVIAAAPELLDALEQLKPILDRAESNASGNPEWDDVSRRVNRARAAIIKAKGGEHGGC